MRIQGEELADYLLRTDGWEKKYRKKTIEKLKKWKKVRGLIGLSPIDHLFLEYHAGKSTVELGKETELSWDTIINLFREYKLPMLTQAEASRENILLHWKDPEFRKRNADAVRDCRKSNIPKIAGYRTDINEETKNAGIANLIRIVRYTGRNKLMPFGQLR